MACHISRIPPFYVKTILFLAWHSSFFQLFKSNVRQLYWIFSFHAIVAKHMSVKQAYLFFLPQTVQLSLGPFYWILFIQRNCQRTFMACGLDKQTTHTVFVRSRSMVTAGSGASTVIFFWQAPVCTLPIFWFFYVTWYKFYAVIKKTTNANNRNQSKMTEPIHHYPISPSPPSSRYVDSLQSSC